MPVISDYSDGTPSISYALWAVDGQELAGFREDVRYYSASTIKLPVLVAVMRAVDAGDLSLEMPLLSRTTFSSGIPGAGEFGFEPDEVDPGMPAPGTETTLRHVLERMIVVSSNEATNIAVELVGFDAVNAVLADLGAASSKMERLIGDMAALEAGRTHEVTAADLVRILHAVVSGRAAGPAATAVMLQFLQAQEFGMIGPALEAGGHRPVWGSKSGWVTGIAHDVAFLAPAGTAVTAPLRSGALLAVCTRGYEPAAAKEAIAAVSSLAWTLAGQLRTASAAASPRIPSPGRPDSTISEPV